MGDRSLQDQYGSHIRLAHTLDRFRFSPASETLRSLSTHKIGTILCGMGDASLSHLLNKKNRITSAAASVLTSLSLVRCGMGESNSRSQFGKLTFYH